LFSMLAVGAKCSVGDQLHPRGVLERPVYERISKVYASVEAKEPWCTRAEALADIGVMLTTSRTAIGDVNKVSEADEGALRALLELKQQFQFVDREADFSTYQVMIFPDTIAFDGALADKVRAYLAGGGKVLLTGQSGLTPSGDAFALDEVGLEYLGSGEYDPDYVIAGPRVNANIPDMPIVQYGGSNRVRPHAGTEVLAERVIPYFQRNWRHYSSHHQTPYDRPSGLPAMTRNGNVVYVAAPVFMAYYQQGYPITRDLLGNALAVLLPDPLVRTSLPSGGQATVLEQAGRRVVHLLYYVWQRRAPDLDVVEDVVPLYDLELAVRVDRAPKKACLVPKRQDLAVRFADGYAHVTVPTVNGHQMVVFEG
jgi:hypothetical protein